MMRFLDNFFFVHMKLFTVSVFSKGKKEDKDAEVFYFNDVLKPRMEL